MGEIVRFVISGKKRLSGWWLKRHSDPLRRSWKCSRQTPFRGCHAFDALCFCLCNTRVRFDIFQDLMRIGFGAHPLGPIAACCRCVQIRNPKSNKKRVSIVHHILSPVFPSAKTGTLVVCCLMINHFRMLRFVRLLGEHEGGGQKKANPAESRGEGGRESRPARESEPQGDREKRRGLEEDRAQKVDLRDPPGEVSRLERPKFLSGFDAAKHRGNQK